MSKIKEICFYELEDIMANIEKEKLRVKALKTIGLEEFWPEIDEVVNNLDSARTRIEEILEG